MAVFFSVRSESALPYASGEVKAAMEIVAGEKGGYELKVLSTNFVQLPNNQKHIFLEMVPIMSMV